MALDAADGWANGTFVAFQQSEPDRTCIRVLVDGDTAQDDRQLHEFNRARDEAARTKTTIDAEIVRQQAQVTIMAKKKADAERALASVGGESSDEPEPPKTPATAAPTTAVPAPPAPAKAAPATPAPATATPAPRRADGSWPPESCRLDDPTTGGCITARTLHALQQARAAGFTRFVSCYRPGGPYEHPKGRACDFSAQVNGFGGVATGGERTYGDNLAAYFVRNANALGVLYVIWYKRIWVPSSGWRAYRSGQGDPSSDHTNHVHLSVY